MEMIFGFYLWPPRQSTRGTELNEEKGLVITSHKSKGLRSDRLSGS